MNFETLKMLLLKKLLLEQEVRRTTGMLSVEIQKILPNHYMGSWECSKSPVGWCILDSDADDNSESCIYCGEPDERK